MGKTSEAKIKINSVEQVYKFVEITGKQDFPVDVHSIDRHYTLDGKSLMGLFSLDLSKPIIVSVKQTSEEADRYFDEISQFIVS